MREPERVATMIHLNLALLLIGGAVLSVGLLSGFFRRHTVSEILVGLVAGVLLGPAVAGVLNLGFLGGHRVVLEELARLTLAIGLMATALRLPGEILRRRWRSLSILLTVVMLVMWVTSSLLIYLILRPPVVVAMLAGAVVTPTDPVLSTTIVTGQLAEQSVRPDVRHMISGESGANDGLALPFVLLSILLLELPTGAALSRWATHVVLREVVGGTGFAILLGYGAGWLLRLAQRRRTIGPETVLAYPSALALVALGGASLLRIDGVLAVFVAGVFFKLALSQGEQEEVSFEHPVLDRLFLLPVFVVLGLVLPWRAWIQLGWRAPVLVVAILLLRRLPFVIALHQVLPPLHDLADAICVGWFGPIGVAALYYAGFALRATGLQQVWTIATLLIVGSVVLHGTTATPFVRWYQARRGARDRQCADRQRSATA